MIKNLRRKFVLVNMICVTLILAVIFAAVILINSNQIKEDSHRTLERALSFSEKRTPIQFNIDSFGTLEAADKLGGFESSSFVIHVDYEGDATIISADNVNIDEEKIRTVVSDVINKEVTIGSLDNYNLRYMVEERTDGIDVAFVDITNEVQQQKQLVFACLIAGIVALCGFFLVSLFLSRWALRPVEKAWNTQRQFAADASHELKTPLTVILANMNILKTNKADKIEDRMEWVENTEAEAERMKDLANNLLYLTKSGDLRRPQISESISVNDVVMKSALAFEPIAFERKIGIETNIEGNVSISGDKSQMTQLMTILLDNAVKYSDDDTTIKVSLKEVSSKAIIKVNNKGKLISKDDLENIFERFYRSDESRSEEGYGLGLAIARNIVQQHRGTINATSDDADGTTLTVTLPAYKS